MWEEVQRTGHAQPTEVTEALEALQRGLCCRNRGQWAVGLCTFQDRSPGGCSWDLTSPRLGKGENNRVQFPEAQ